MYLSAVQIKEIMDKAKHDKTIVTDFEAGQILKVKLSASKNLAHSSNLHRAKREWFTFPRFAKERINRVEDVLTLG